MSPSNSNQKINQEMKNAYPCDFCEKVYIVKSSYQSHMRKKHTEQVQSAKNTNKAKLTRALENSQADGLYKVSNILEEVLTSITKNQEDETNNLNDEDPPEKQDDDMMPHLKSSVDPNDDWLAHTNTDMGLMLECAQLSLALEQCDECGYTLEYGESLNDHKTSEHMGQLSRVCSNCGEFFSTVTNLNEHNLAKHTPTFSGITTCKGCIKLKQVEGFKNVALEKKEETIKQLGVKLRQMACDKKALKEKVAKLEELVKETEEPESKEDNVENLLPRIYDCKKCKFTSATVHDYYDHLKQKHKSKYSCQMCSMTFMFKPTLKAHMKQKHNVKIVKQSTKDCHECKMKDEVIKHNESELNKKEKDKQDIDKLHQKHEAMKERYNNVLKSQGDKKELFKENTLLREQTKSGAEKLQETLKQNQILEDQNKVMKGIIETNEAMKEDLEFQERTADMTEEVRKHNKPLISCTKCDYKTRNNNYLKGHMQSHLILPNKCRECVKMFKTEQELQNHIKVSHKKEKEQFNCNKCEKTFTTHIALKQHAQTKHEPSSRIPVGHQTWARQQNTQQIQRSFCCPECFADFRNEPDLRVHMKTHDKDIQCSLCDEMFTTKQDQNHHMRTVHRGASTKFTKVQKPCRYFLQGWCTKGQMCSFSHVLPYIQWSQQEQEVPTCRRGPGCTFWVQGNCYFFHPQGGARGWQEQEQHLGVPGEVRQQKRKLCHFQETCWNPECQFEHEDFGQSREFLENY